MQFFVAAVYREIITIGVDYTQILKKKDCERKGKMYVFPITGGPLQREREEVLCEKMKRFLNFNYAEIFDFS